jgi:hypothetical protein
MRAVTRQHEHRPAATIGARLLDAAADLLGVRQDVLQHVAALSARPSGSPPCRTHGQ